MRHGDLDNEMDYGDGKRYIGAFVNDVRDGLGTLIFADGSRYVGPWKND